jgi:hypothetical protein
LPPHDILIEAFGSLAVIDADGAGRIQIVRTEDDPITYAHLKVLVRRIDVEMSVNTSFVRACWWDRRSAAPSRAPSITPATRCGAPSKPVVRVNPIRTSAMHRSEIR